MITVDALLKSPNLEELRVIAGHDGLNREVRTVSVMDAPDSYKWLKGGEFILTSGFLFGGDVWQLEHFIDNLIEAGSAAIGIKKGRFLNEVPDIIQQKAEQYQFPIVEIPYHFVWSEIISTFYELLHNTNKNTFTSMKPDSPEGQENAAGSELLCRKFMLSFQSGKITPDEVHNFEELRGFKGTVYFGVMLIESTDTMKVYHHLGNVFNNARFAKKGKVNKHIVDDAAKQEAVVMLEFYPNANEPPEKWQFMLFEEMELYTQDISGGSIAMGRLYPSLTDIVMSYSEAKKSRAIGRALWDNKRCFFYSMLSIYSVLQNVNPSEIDLSYMHMLDDNKAGLSFDGIETLEAYIEYGSYKKAASKLFVHENTLRYRIQKIEDFLHLDLDDSTVCNALIVQIKLWRLMKEK